MTTPPTAPPSSVLADSIAQRLLDEGAQPLLAAAQMAGLNGDALPSLKTFLRAVSLGRLDAVKVGGRWLTSPSAIRRWVAEQQRIRDNSAEASAL